MATTKPPRVKRPTSKHPALMKHSEHARLWRMVEGAVVSALMDHDDYLTDKGRREAVQSITKRVVGHLVGHARQVSRAPRKGEGPLGGRQAELGGIAGSAVDELTTTRRR